MSAYYCRVSIAEQDTELPAAGPGFALWRVSNAWQRAVRSALEPWGLTHAQAIVLATLDAVGGNGQAKQHQVAQAAGMDPMTTSQVVRVLESKELVKRAKHPEDGRAVTLTLTQKGKRVLSKAMPAIAEVDERFFSGAGRNRSAFVSALAAMVSPEAAS